MRPSQRNLSRDIIKKGAESTLYELAPQKSRLPMIEQFEYDSAHCYGVHRCCAIQMWRGHVEARHVPLMEQRWLRLIESKGGFATLVVVLPSAPTPSSARREEIKRVYSALDKHIRAVGTVIEDQGVKGTAGAMVMTTIMLMSKTPYPYKNGTAVEPIAAWLCQEVQDLDAGKLVEAVEQMRRQFADITAAEFGEPLIPRLRAATR